MFASLMSRLKVLFVPLSIVIVAIALFVYFAKTKPVQMPVEVKEKVWLVSSMTAKFESLSPVQTLFGKVESSAMVLAASPISGVVDTVSVKEGDLVKAGGALVQMSLADLDLPIQQAKADVADARAQVALQKLANKANRQRLAHEQKVLGLKQVKVKRTEALIKRDLASQADLDTVNEALVRQEFAVVGARLSVEENQLKAAQNQARLAKAKAGLAQAMLNKKRGQLVAPYDVRIAQVPVSEGSRVNLGAGLVRYYGLDSLELRAKLPITQLDNIQSALHSGEALSARYTRGGSIYKLPVSRLAGQATTSGLDIFFTLPKALKQSRPGDLMEVHLQGERIERVVAIPYSALYGQNKVYLIEDGRLLSKRVKVVGDISRDGQLWALISPSFNEGSTLCVTHLPNAVTGLKVSEEAK